MPTHITQIEDLERNRTILRVAGEMHYEDAVLLERIAVEISENGAKNITLDLADLDFLDSESAPVIKRMEREHNFRLEGVEIFLQSMIDETERRGG